MEYSEVMKMTAKRREFEKKGLVRVKGGKRTNEMERWEGA